MFEYDSLTTEQQLRIQIIALMGEISIDLVMQDINNDYEWIQNGHLSLDTSIGFITRSVQLMSLVGRKNYQRIQGKRICKKCDKPKPLDEFPKAKCSWRSKTGYEYTCKECKK